MLRVRNIHRAVAWAPAVASAAAGAPAYSVSLTELRKAVSRGCVKQAQKVTARTMSTSNAGVSGAATTQAHRSGVRSSESDRDRNVRTGILMMNMGGPETIDQVGPYLSNLFADGDIIPLGPLQPWLGPLISKRRTPKVTKQYEIIGGSPIRKWTDIQGREMCKLLDKIAPESGPHKHYIAFRYVSPTTLDALLQMKADGVKRVVAFSQYPQYSCSTTGSSLNELYRQLKAQNMQNDFEWSVIDRWPNHRGHAQAVAHQIQMCLDSFDVEVRDSVLVLFSAHSLPISAINRGDPYPTEVSATAHLVMSELQLPNPFRIVWQSQVGPSTWLGPQTDDALHAFVKRGVTNIIIVPIAFTNDHIETLYELDHEYIGKLHEMGYTNVKRAGSLNDDPIFIKALADIAAGHIKSGNRSSNVLRLRCTSCKNPRCKPTRDFFC